MTLRGLSFYKMTGSGNDFVFFDGRDVDPEALTKPEVVSAICNRHNGIGADGLVILQPVENGVARILYYNSDGSPADLCGNATLCSTTLSTTLGMSDASAMTLLTPAGPIAARFNGSLPEIDLGSAAVQSLSSEVSLGIGELQVGFVVAGIPHLVVRCEAADDVDLKRRGPTLRRHVATGPAGANVNWVSPRPDGSWRYRTFERGVEGETLACGTGAIATAVQLVEWGLAESPVRIRTSSGRDLVVRLNPGTEGMWRTTLIGEGRIVFAGRIGDLPI